DMKYIPVIMMTGIKIDDRGRIDAIDSGADSFLAKPFREAELLTQMRAMLRIKAAEDQLQEKMNTLKSLVGYSSSALRDERENKKKTENIIRMYADIIDNMRLGLIVYHLEDIDDDRTLRLIHVNPACLEILGLVGADLVGKTLDENFPGLRENGIPQRYAEVIRTGEHTRFQDFYYKDERLPRAGYWVHAFPLSNYCVGVLFESSGERKRMDPRPAIYRNCSLLVLPGLAGDARSGIIADDKSMQFIQRFQRERIFYKNRRQQFPGGCRYQLQANMPAPGTSPKPYYRYRRDFYHP
ncbi:MAG: PAS domain-containing protein, partial [bacterium]|nr:PAS domain-containing protein [bacterium]